MGFLPGGSCKDFETLVLSAGRKGQESLESQGCRSSRLSSEVRIRAFRKGGEGKAKSRFKEDETTKNSIKDGALVG